MRRISHFDSCDNFYRLLIEITTQAILLFFQLFKKRKHVRKETRRGEGGRMSLKTLHSTIV